MDNTTPSGFRHAPVSKFLVEVIGGCSIAAALLNVRTVNLPPLWRAVVSSCTFGSVGHTVIGTWLLYRMRIIERHSGSPKYAAFVFISLIASALLQAGAHRFLNFKMSGPYAILFAMLCQFHHIIPASSRFPLFGTTVSDKIYVYLAAAQMMLANASVVTPCICGLTSGLLYVSNVGNIKTWRFPFWRKSRPAPSFNTSSNATADASIGSSSSSRVPQPTGDVRQRSAEQEIQVSEENINAMSSMFPNVSRDAVASALISAKNDMNRAADILLNMGD
ncbi:hypothetical protein K492DRAFT_156806 [Lichtheimia hyalospora FSU 10163]|nr:hypothetical protein K492DRAFT_156806 [Lichtheimia hyalospora FSU 10163]